MNYDEKLDLLIEDVRAIKETLVLLGTSIQPQPPADIEGLYQFVRPDPNEPRYGKGIRMTAPDKEEAINRALYGVRWNGDVVRSGVWEDEAWEEIERLKHDVELQKKYGLLQPEFAGFALLTGLLDPTKYDGFIGQQKRDAFAGKTVQGWLDEQWAIMAGGAAPGFGGQE